MDASNQGECWFALQKKLFAMQAIETFLAVPSLNQINVRARNFASDERQVSIVFRAIWCATAFDGKSEKIVAESCFFDSEESLAKFVDDVEGHFVLEKMAAPPKEKEE